MIPFSTLTPVLFRALSLSLGLDPESPSAQDLIRPAWSNTPQTSIDTDVVYFDLQADTSSSDGYLSGSGTGVSRTIPLTLHLVFYGPNAVENAHRVRTHLFLEDSPSSPRRILRGANLVPIPDPSEPGILHEPEGSLWRTRCDLFLRLRWLTSESHTMPKITEPPEINPIIF